MSIPNINCSNRSSLNNSIQKVVQSIERVRKINKNDQIIIQIMLSHVSMSGVVFTKNIENGSNYYSINYDDLSGKTDLVTSGKTEDSNKMLYVRKNHLDKLRSPRFRSLIKAVKNLETIFNSDKLDIEFAVDKKNKTYLLQVRKLNIQKNKKISEKNIENKIFKVSQNISKKLKNKNSRFGKNNIFGNMPDWNPAEIIGQFPSYLSRSLFCELITNSIWADARNEIGYQSLREKKLVNFFAGQPYVDIRMSFNSFLINNINSSSKEKLINHWLEMLKKNPEFHDKIEFLICLNCFTFDNFKKSEDQFPKSISLKEIQGQYMGLLFFKPSGWKKIKRLINNLNYLKKMSITDVLNVAVKNKIKIKALKYNNLFFEIDTNKDLIVARDKFKETN